MKEIIVYTNETCPYCKQVKEELTKANIEFEEKSTKDFIEEWNQISNLTGMATVPTVHYNQEYLVPGRDFNNPQNLVNILNNYKENNIFDYSRQALERTKTLNYNMGMAFTRVDQLLRQIENKLNIEENEHKSTS